MAPFRRRRGRAGGSLRCKTCAPLPHACICQPQTFETLSDQREATERAAGHAVLQPARAQSSRASLTCSCSSSSFGRSSSSTGWTVSRPRSLRTVRILKWLSLSLAWQPVFVACSVLRVDGNASSSKAAGFAAAENASPGALWREGQGAAWLLRKLRGGS